MTVIPKNGQIIVKRIPVTGGRRNTGAGASGMMGSSFASRSAAAASGSSFGRPFIPSASTISAAPGGGSEEEKKIRAMMQATGSHWEQNQQEMPLQQMGPRRLFRPSNFRSASASAPPDNYVCYRCGQKGNRYITFAEMVTNFLLMVRV